MKNKLIEVYRADICISDGTKIRQFAILPAVALIFRADQKTGRLKYWHCTIEWMEWYVNIRNPWYKKTEPAKHTHQAKDPPWLAKAMEEEEKT